MSQEADHTRRWLINAGGAAILSGAMRPASAQSASPQAAPAAAAAAAAAGAETAAPVSAATTALADHVAKALDRELAPEVAAHTKLHVLDTLAAIALASAACTDEVTIGVPITIACGVPPRLCT